MGGTPAVDGASTGATGSAAAAAARARRRPMVHAVPNAASARVANGSSGRPGTRAKAASRPPAVQMARGLRDSCPKTDEPTAVPPEP
jgi:hypothetical protein